VGVANKGIALQEFGIKRSTKLPKFNEESREYQRK
jgi:hypothetical protein